MNPKRAKLVRTALDFLTQVVTCAGSALCIAGVVAPWAQTKIFNRVDLAIPGALFAESATILISAAFCLILRRYRLATLVCVCFAFVAYQHAIVDVPREVKSHIIGAQASLFPINRLLDQANIPQITVGNFGLRDEQYLAYGLDWTRDGIIVMAAGSVAGATFDPLIWSLYKRFGVRRCKHCSTKIGLSRSVDYCPSCGFWQHQFSEPLRCSYCQTVALPTDTHCVRCGELLSNPA